METKVETVKTTIGEFLVRRLKEAGVDDIFGVPGDFALGFFNEIIKSDINYIGTCNELNAAYAADGYARIKGIGALATTYCVGELSAINGVAGSWAESVPVVQITGWPSTLHCTKGTLLHHSLGNYNTPKEMYEKITIASILLNKTAGAVEAIDHVLTACLTHKLPVYIGICSDMVKAEIVAPVQPFQKPTCRKSDPLALEEAVLEALTKLHKSRQPILIPGVEIQRLGLVEDFKALVEASGMPYTTMMLGKAILDEDHPQYIGLYCGDNSREYVKKRVEESDCILIFGEKFTDFNTGGFSALLDFRSTINASKDKVQISYHTYNNVYLRDFILALTRLVVKRDTAQMCIEPATAGCVHTRFRQMVVEPQKDLSMTKLFDRMAHFIPENSVVLAETGSSLFSAAEVLMPKGTHFIGQTFYGSIGYTVGACLGACIAKKDSGKVFLFIGDGSFQVTCQDMSTMIRYGCKPLIILVNNDGYTIERVIVDHCYNDIQMWKYADLPKVFGGGKSYRAKTEGELETALVSSENFEELNFIEVFLDKMDCNEALRRAGKTMAKNNKLID